MTNTEALKNLYVALGGSRAEVADLNTTANVINAIAGFASIKDTGVQPAKASAEYWGTKVSAMQTGLTVADGAITGTLKFIPGGIAPGTLEGDGNFMALKFIDTNDVRPEDIKVGLVPSSSGMEPVALDSDMDCVFKVSSTEQVLKVITTKDGVEKTQIFDLSGLTLNTEA